MKKVSSKMTEVLDSVPPERRYSLSLPPARLANYLTMTMVAGLLWFLFGHTYPQQGLGLALVWLSGMLADIIVELWIRWKLLWSQTANAQNRLVVKLLLPGIVRLVFAIVGFAIAFAIGDQALSWFFVAVYIVTGIIPLTAVAATEYALMFGSVRGFGWFFLKQIWGALVNSALIIKFIFLSPVLMHRWLQDKNNRLGP